MKPVQAMRQMAIDAARFDPELLAKFFEMMKAAE